VCGLRPAATGQEAIIAVYHNNFTDFFDNAIKSIQIARKSLQRRHI
jgi:hypothetical protein